MKKKDLSDLEKARDHFIRATTEGIIGTGFALKGIRNLMKESEGRKLVADFTGKFIGRGFDLVTNLSDILKPSKESSSTKPRNRKKRTKKVEIE
jgi:hypothetical protein